MRKTQMKIKELRKDLKLSQTDFGKKFHIPMRSIQNWENGKTVPPEYIEWMINYILILENECEQLRSGQLEIGTQSEEEQQPHPEPATEKNTDKVQKLDIGTKQRTINLQNYMSYNELCEMLKKASE